MSLTDKSGTAGGLRIRRITNLDNEDNVLGAKQYYYSNTRDRFGKSSGILKSLPVNEMVYTLRMEIRSLILRMQYRYISNQREVFSHQLLI